MQPILARWKDQYGNFSDKVCEAIVFTDRCTTELIYQAIMAYEARKDDSITTDSNRPLLPWEKETIRMLAKGLDPTRYLTEAPAGPLLARAEAKLAMVRLARLKHTLHDSTESPFEVLVKQYPLHRARLGYSDFRKGSTEELKMLTEVMEYNLCKAQEVLQEREANETPATVAVPKEVRLK